MKSILLFVTLFAFSLCPCGELLAQSDCRSPGSISGYIKTIRGEAIENIDITVTSRNSSVVQTSTTDARGFYLVEGLPHGQDYDISLVKYDAFPHEGLDNRDLMLLSRLALRIDSTTYWHIFNADINRNGIISTFDLIELNKLIRRITDGIPGIDGHWRFLPDNATVGRAFNDYDLSPLAAPVILGLQSEATMNFTGVKVGDLDFSARGN